jgi:epoxyqueuosine reductase
MDDLIIKSSMIKAEAFRLGFDGCGIAQAEKLEEEGSHLSDWLKKQYQGTMNYMERHFEMRVDPEKLVEDARSVISVILNYFPKKTQVDPCAPVISKYAYGKDYHDVIREKLNKLLQFIQVSFEPVHGRGFVDSAPVLDRAWAARAGLGWIGKNSNLISPTIGSYFFIGSLIVDIPLIYDRPLPDFCGDCNRCLYACPTQAIVSPKVIDARRCISYLTIENKGEIDTQFRDQFSNRVFGCDICQDVCPWNKKAIPHRITEFEPVGGLLEMTREDWFNLNEDQYKQRFSGSAVKRAKYKGLLRNLQFIHPDSGRRHDEDASLPQ